MDIAASAAGWRQRFARLPTPPSSNQPLVRKNQTQLAATEQESFIAAIKLLINGGVYGALVAIHGQNHMQHDNMGEIGMLRFLPWHRVYLHVLEQYIQGSHPGLGIPYWDWTVDQEIPPWLIDFTPTVPLHGHPIQVFRQPGVRVPSLPSPAVINAALTNATYPAFAQALENAHDQVHNWVGGVMSDLQHAPADPIFFLHHANVDRLWWQWQQAHADQHPDLAPPMEVFDPWSDAEPKTRNIGNYNDRYA